MYNLTNVTAANNMFEIMEATNALTGGLLFVFLMVVLFITFLAVFHKADFKKVLVGDCFFITILAALGYAGGFIGFEVLLIPLFMLLGSIIVYMFID